MTEPSPSPAVPDRPPAMIGAAADALAGQSAGAIMKAARERQGLHIAILAATIKVSPRKLEALEQDRYEELSNTSFVRALAQSVCRSLKIDPRPVLALLPVPDPAALERAVGSLNAPFRERPGRGESSMQSGTSRPALWAGALLLLGAAAVYFLPPEVWTRAWQQPERSTAEPTTAPPAPVLVPRVAVAEPAASSWALPPASAATPASAAAALSAVVNPIPQAPRDAPAVVAMPASAAASGRLLLTASASSWVEVVDTSGKVLLSRTLAAGEAVDLDGAFPLRLKVGNAAGLQVALRGQAVDLSNYTRDNVARFELR